MRFFALAALATVAAASLAACNKPAAPAPAPKADAGTPVAASDLPVRKGGIWELKTQMPDMPAAAAAMGGRRMCVGEGPMKADDFRRGRRAGGACSPTATRQPDGSIQLAGECDLPMGGHMKMVGVVTGDFQSHYKADFTNTMSGGTPMDGERKFSMEATWIGPCPAGVAPGTMLDANNKPMSVEDMRAEWRERRDARKAAEGGDAQ